MKVSHVLKLFVVHGLNFMYNDLFFNIQVGGLGCHINIIKVDFSYSASP